MAKLGVHQATDETDRSSSTAVSSAYQTVTRRDGVNVMASLLVDQIVTKTHRDMHSDNRVMVRRLMAIRVAVARTKIREQPKIDRKCGGGKSNHKSIIGLSLEVKMVRMIWQKRKRAEDSQTTRVHFNGDG